MTVEAASDPDSNTQSTQIWAWRHPRPIGAEGRCIGRTDLQLNPRKALRLARHIHKTAALHQLPRVVYTSCLQRCANVGRVLGTWGWEHRIDDALLEFDFGLWDGKAWTEIGQTEVNEWIGSFGQYAPGGGETLATMLDRAAGWSPQLGTQEPSVVVAHAGWMLARQWRQSHGSDLPDANQWPPAPAYGQLCRFASGPLNRQA